MPANEQPPTPQDFNTLLWRVGALEQIEKAIQLELHELRREIPAALQQCMREDYYSKPEARNIFVTREELSASARTRREWPIVLASVTAAIATVVTLIVTLSHAAG